MVTRRFIMQKARRHMSSMLRPLVGAWFQDLFHSPRRGAFHLSLTVLVHYRSHGSLSPCRLLPAYSRRLSRVPRYSGYHWALTSLHIRGSHSHWPNIQERSVRDPSAVAWSHYPDAALLQRRFGLIPVRSPLLGESLLFSLPRGTMLFQFLWFDSSQFMMMAVL